MIILMYYMDGGIVSFKAGKTEPYTVQNQMFLIIYVNLVIDTCFCWGLLIKCK